MDELKPGLYLHYKGGLYRVLGTGEHTETGEKLVVYTPESGGKIWIRPLAMFREPVVQDGVERPRFVPVEEAEALS